MVTIRRILVPTDLSNHSLVALEYASSFSVLYDARLFLLHVADVVPPVLPLPVEEGGSDVYRRRAEEEAARLLQAFVEGHISRDIRLTPVVRIGAPADEIRRFAEDEHMDLVVMATHGRTGLRHIVMGSIAETVVRHSRVPVLTVKPPELRESFIRIEDIENELHLK